MRDTDRRRRREELPRDDRPSLELPLPIPPRRPSQPKQDDDADRGVWVVELF